MVSRNNVIERKQQSSEEKQHFAIRKLTVGAASVLIGLSFLGVSNHTVKAAANNNGGSDEGDAPSDTTHQATSRQNVDTSSPDTKVVVEKAAPASSNTNQNSSSNSVAQTSSTTANNTKEATSANQKSPAQSSGDQKANNLLVKQSDAVQDKISGNELAENKAVSKDGQNSSEVQKSDSAKAASNQKVSDVSSSLPAEYQTTVSRKIEIDYPDGFSPKSRTITNSLNFANAQLQEDNHKTTVVLYDDKQWHLIDEGSNYGNTAAHVKYPEQEISTLDGYDPKASVNGKEIDLDEHDGKYYIPATAVNTDANGKPIDDTEAQLIKVTYQAKQISNTIVYLDNDDPDKKPVGSQVITGSTGELVKLSVDGSNGTIKYKIPAGYELVPGNVVSGIYLRADAKNPVKIYVQVKDKEVNQEIDFVDSSNPSNIIGQQTLQGKADTQQNIILKQGDKGIALQIPKGWQLVPGTRYITQFIYQRNATPIVYTIEHKIDTLDGRDAQNHGNADLYHEVSETVNITNPDGSKQTPVTNTIELYRIAKTDEATGHTTYSPWQSNTEWTGDTSVSTSFKPMTMPTVAGYKTVVTGATLDSDGQTLPALSALDEKGNPANNYIINVSFAPQNQTATINYVDNSNKTTVVGSQVLSGKTGQTINLSLDGKTGTTKLNVPANWQITNGAKYPTSITLGSSNNITTVYVEHATTQVPQDDKDGTQKIVTRTITINYPGQNPVTYKQEVSWARTGVKDSVTGKITYGKWQVNSVDQNNKPVSDWSEVEIDYKGYTPVVTDGNNKQITLNSENGKQFIPLVTPNVNDSDVSLTVNYTPESRKFTINYVDDQDASVKFDPQIINGVTGQTVNFTLNIPQGYQATGEVPGSPLRFGTEDGSATVHLVKAIDPNQEYTYTINYVDNSDKTNVVGNQVISGKAGETKGVTLNVPTGWKLLDKEKFPTSVTFGNQNQTQNLFVEKDSSSKPDNPSANDVTETIQYVSEVPNDRNGQIIGTQNLTGKAGSYVKVDWNKTGEQGAVSASVPEHWTISSNNTLYEGYNLKAGNVIKINICHKLDSINKNDPRVYKVVTRTINYTYADGRTTYSSDPVTFEKKRL